jgi:cell division transport system permease protein
MSKTSSYSLFGRMQWLTSCISTTLVLLLLGLVVLCSLSAYRLSEAVRENLVVTLILDDDVDSTATADLMSYLALQPYSREMTLVSAEEALAEQTEAMGTDPSDFLGQNPFTASVEMNVCSEYAQPDSLEVIADELRLLWQVSDVVYQPELAESLNSMLQRAAIVLAVLALLLTFVSIVLINNTVRLSVYSRRFIIHTMRLVGASWAFIRRPFLLRSMAIGLVASVVASAVLVGIVEWMLAYDASVATVITRQVTAVMLGAVFVSGLLLTLVCTWFSVGRFLRMRESELYK